MSLYPGREWRPSFPLGYTPRAEPEVYAGSPLRPQSEWSALELPPELDRLVRRDLGPRPVDSRAVAAVRRVLDRSSHQEVMVRKRSSTSLTVRLEQALEAADGALTSAELGRLVDVEAPKVRSVISKIVRAGRAQVRYIRQRPDVAADLQSVWGRRMAQYLAPGRRWPDPPEGFAA